MRSAVVRDRRLDTESEPREGTGDGSLKAIPASMSWHSRGVARTSNRPSRKKDSPAPLRRRTSRIGRDSPKTTATSRVFEPSGARVRGSLVFKSTNFFRSRACEVQFNARLQQKFRKLFDTASTRTASARL